MLEHQVVGASIVVIENGRARSSLHLGNESADAERPVNKGSVFQVGSISKPVAAWVVMTLVRDGKVDLDTPVAQYLTRWRIPKSDFDVNGVTLRRLLSHTAGLRLAAYSGFPEQQGLPTLEASLLGDTNGAGPVKVVFEPGANYRYSGGGYSVIQLLVEEVSGMSFSDYAQKSVLTPLGMTRTSFEPDGDLMKSRVTPHGHHRDTVEQHHFRAQAAASLHTTAEDLARFALANMSSNPVLSQDLVSMMHTSVADAGFADIGLGFFISGEGNLVGHGGSNLGWRAELQLNPKQQNGLIVLTNSEGSARFLSEIKCHWDSTLTNPVLSKPCADETRHLAQSRTLANWLTIIVALLISALVIKIVRGYRSATVVFERPSTVLRLLLLLVLASATLFVVCFIYTPLGIYLVAGFRSIFATIYYAPVWLGKLAPWLVGLLVTLCVMVLLVPSKDVKS